jgi:glyoxylase-like metal-dependent hydrolase (beta-lactamase superfamily II)
MEKNTGSTQIKRLVSTAGKNQYLLVSAGEAAAIDVSEAQDEVGSLLDDMGIGLKYLLITHAHKSHLQALPDLKNKYGGTFCLHEYAYQRLSQLLCQKSQRPFQRQLFSEKGIR